MASPPVIVNHSVVRAGTSARATAAGLAAYAGTRRGVVIEVSEADGRRLGVDGLAAYAANRTGSTGGLWGAGGPVAVAEARRAIAQNGGALREALDRAASDSPELAGALDRHRKAVERCADLKCLTGEARDVYTRKAAAGLGLRCENAALRVMVPDRTPIREQIPARRAAPAAGPATDRRREAGFATEARACIPKARLERLTRKVAHGRTLEPADLRGCPTADRAFRHAPSPGPALGRAAAMAALVARETARDAGGRDMGDEAGERLDGLTPSGRF